MMNKLGIGMLLYLCEVNHHYHQQVVLHPNIVKTIANLRDSSDQYTSTSIPACQRARVWGDRCGQFAVLSTTITRNLQIAAPNKCRLKTPKMWWLVRYCLGGSWGVPGYPVLRLQILWQNNILLSWLLTGHWTFQLATTIHLHHS